MLDHHYNKFCVRADHFDHPSLLHGINHTYRVMLHVLELGKLASLNHEIREAFCAAFIHDMARKHDGFCQAHGAWSAQRKLPLFSDLFLTIGVTRDGLETIKLAVTNHSVHNEISKDHPDYKTVALLKDADALDRIRISNDDLRPEYLRFPQTHHQIEFARQLYYATNKHNLESFEEIVKIASLLKNA
ncbi:MAG: HD domain-containing protein [Bacteroidales bacterium]|nr:HD domain-containing protein [Bacteroidales bacterium]